jgi:hypothetical protein
MLCFSDFCTHGCLCHCPPNHSLATLSCSSAVAQLLRQAGYCCCCYHKVAVLCCCYPADAAASAVAAAAVDASAAAIVGPRCRVGMNRESCRHEHMVLLPRQAATTAAVQLAIADSVACLAAAAAACLAAAAAGPRGPCGHWRQAGRLPGQCARWAAGA